MATRKVRYKKLNIKTILSVLQEGEVDASEYENLGADNQIATGVEQAEEKEFHLQAALQGDASTAQEIPVPPPQASELNYDKLYSQKFAQPSAYIRFSQTVEESVGCQYDMTEDDEAFLKTFNQSRPNASKLSEEDFEQAMEVFEDTAFIKTPFASVDNTIVPYDEMAGLQLLESNTKILTQAKLIYEYWRTRRQALGNQPLHPTLKFETHQETDETDPYVCFRRREVRQTRKTRARDVQSADKLKRLRRELEEGCELIHRSHEREVLKRSLLHADRQVFDQRAHLRQIRARLGIKGEDDDLWNCPQQREKRKATTDAPTIQRPPPPPNHLRLSVRTDGRSVETELVQLADKLAEKENALQAEIQSKTKIHEQWNKNHVDLTAEPLPPVQQERQAVLSFRPVRSTFLITPPASASGDELTTVGRPAADSNGVDGGQMATISASARSGDDGAKEEATAPSHFCGYRRRTGRLNMQWIDRRRGRWSQHHVDYGGSDRWKYDHDSDEDDDPPEYEVDLYSIEAMKFRSSLVVAHLPSQYVPQTAAQSWRLHLLQQAENQQAMARQGVGARLGVPGGPGSHQIRIERARVPENANRSAAS